MSRMPDGVIIMFESDSNGNSNIVSHKELIKCRSCKYCHVEDLDIYDSDKNYLHTEKLSYVCKVNKQFNSIVAPDFYCSMAKLGGNNNG